ncbi:hypothetical protein BVRB_7g163160 [Beta vulgaris subsp. vulgaris]|nr:hypothetical protein BVRB_7g163160 [Beta vulgaris subsp. vulgaris]
MSIMTTRTIVGMPWSVLSLSNRRISTPPKFIRASSSSAVPNKNLILYSKPGCCLCDGLKEKLLAAFSISDLNLQIRDITTNPEWEKAYQYEIPVLAKLCADGTEETLPRLSPRLSVEAIQRKIGDAFRQ